jgi:hypothetical protein
MKISKIYMILMLLICSQRITAMSPSFKIVAALYNQYQKFSPQTINVINSIIRVWNFDNTKSEGEFIETCSKWGPPVKKFDIPVSDQNEITERLRSLRKQSFLFVAKPALSVMGILETSDKNALIMSTDVMRDFYQHNDAMKAILEHEYCHLQHEDGLTRKLFYGLMYYATHFSVDELYRAQAAFGEDFLNRKDALVTQIVAQAKGVGIKDLKDIEDFNLDYQAYIRYHEERADSAIWNSGNRKMIEAYRDYMKDDRRYGFWGDKTYRLEKWLDIQKAKKKNGGLIPQGIMSFDHPTVFQRVDAGDKALARLDGLKK